MVFLLNFSVLGVNMYSVRVHREQRIGGNSSLVLRRVVCVNRYMRERAERARWPRPLRVCVCVRFCDSVIVTEVVAVVRGRGGGADFTDARSGGSRE